VINITINGMPCRGGGWEVMECLGGNQIPTTIIPAATKRNDLGGVTKDGEKEFSLRYKADFSVLQTESTMVITTSHRKEFKFSLIARVPKEDIAACRKVIPRPSWEPPCRRVILIMMIVLLVGILIMGFIESNYIIEPWLHIGLSSHKLTLYNSCFQEKRLPIQLVF